MRRLFLLPLALAQIAAAKPAPVDLTQYQSVSLIAPIANPAVFEGRKICVRGFLTSEFEDLSICLDQNAHDHALLHNCLWVAEGREGRAALRRPSRRYADVCGTFHSKSEGYQTSFSGELADVQRIDAREDFSTRMYNQRNAIWPWIALGWLVLTAILTAILAWPLLWLQRRQARRPRSPAGRR